MKIKFLGTAACEGIPAMFCDCGVCRTARKRGGRDIRTRSQAIVDDKILIDFPADTFMHVLRENLKLQDYEHLLITHSHSDHLYAPDLENRKPGFAYFSDRPSLKVYSCEDGYNSTQKIIEVLKISERVEAVKIENDFAKNDFAIDDYLISPIKANHDVFSSPVIFAITHKGESLLYGNDTGYLCEESWEKLRALKKPFNLVSLDCTCGMQKNVTIGHMSLDTVIKTLERMKNENIINEQTKVVINHFSHNCLINYDELVQKANENNIIVSYDGLEIDF